MITTSNNLSAVMVAIKRAAYLVHTTIRKHMHICIHTSHKQIDQNCEVKQIKNKKIELEKKRHSSI